MAVAGGAPRKKKMNRGAGTFLPASVEKWIAEFGDDFGFQPMVHVKPTQHEPGSVERVEEMRSRIRRGQPLFAKGDRVFHDGSSSSQFEAYATNPRYTVWRGNDQRGVEHSDCGRYRYRIWNNWETGKPIVSFIGLQAEAKPDGRLDRKLKALASSHGCGGYQLLNLFAVKCNKPQDVWRIEDSIGDANDTVIRLSILKTSFTVCCWGRIGLHMGRSSRVLWAVSETIPRARVFCYGLTPQVRGSIDDTRKYPYPISIGDVQEGSALMAMPWRFMDLGEENRKED